LPEQRDRLAAILEEVVRRRRPSLEAYTKFFWAKVEEFQYESLHDDVEYTDVYHWENRSSRWYAEISNETDKDLILYFRSTLDGTIKSYPVPKHMYVAVLNFRLMRFTVRGNSCWPTG